MNRFSKRWREKQERQMKKKLDLAIRLEEVGVTIIEPEKMELENLQELHDKHFLIVQKDKVKKGRYLNYREIAELAGVNYSTFIGRIRKGYSLEKAILGEPENYLTYKEIAELAGIPYHTLTNWMRRGYTLEQVLVNAENGADKPRKNKMDRHERKKRRTEILMHLNVLEQKNGDPEIIARLERELANV